MILHVNADHIGDFCAARANFIVDDGFSAIGVERNRDFFCHFVNAVAVGTICRDAHVEDNIVVFECFERVLTERRALCKANDVARLLILYVVLGYADFFETAKHTLADDASEFAFLDVVTVRKVRAVKRDRNGFAALYGNVGHDLNGL